MRRIIQWHEEERETALVGSMNANSGQIVVMNTRLSSDPTENKGGHPRANSSLSA